MPSILTVSDSYLPGFKGGGPIRSLANLIEWLGDEFRFLVLTPDRDHTDSRPYDSVSRGVWQKVGKAEVMYLPPDLLRIVSWNRLIVGIDYDLLYLNSFFSTLTVRTLLLRRKGKLRKTPVILAPRGEFSPGALSLKGLKKRLYIAAGKRLGLFEDILWHATSDSELEHITRWMEDGEQNNYLRIAVAPNLASTTRSMVPAARARIKKKIDSVRLVFLSRIVPMKNLKTALELLADRSGSVVFDIYGPIEDPEYWQECQLIIRELPSNVQVSYKGIVNPDGVVSTFTQYHALFFPTLGENFGHVILEALTAGCLVLTSSETPWRNLASKGAGWDIPLSQPESYRQALDEIIKMDCQMFQARSEQARRLASETTTDISRVQMHRKLFVQALADPQTDTANANDEGPKG